MKNFEELRKKLKKTNEKKILTLVCAEEEDALEAVCIASKEKLIFPILIGCKKKIENIILEKELNFDFEILNETDKKKSVLNAIKLVKEGKTDIIMKGLIQTDIFLAAIVKNVSGIKRNHILSHIALIEAKSKNKIYLISDGGIIPTPSIEQKIEIIRNSINFAKKLDINIPKIALLSASESINPKILSSIESAYIAQMKWNDAIVEGPISIDLAISKKYCIVKEWKGRIRGDADILITPDIISGNILGKWATLTNNGEIAGIVEGAQVPIVLTSRASSINEKLNSIMLACGVSNEK